MALEQETDAILRILAERTIGDNDGCRLESLMQAEVPQGIKNFFRAEIRRKLGGDLTKSSWFSGIQQSDGGAARIAQTLVVSLTDAYQFPRGEFLDTLDLAVHFVANYLCRPQWTLENFLFDQGPRIPLTALSDGLAYVADYRYLGELALRSLQRRGQSEVGREEFQLLIGKIDEEVVRQHNARELASLTRPLFQFFQIPESQPGGAIPIEALLVFFEDKRLRILKEYISGMCHLRNRAHVTFEELTHMIEDLFAGKTASHPTALPRVADGSREVEPPSSVSPGTSVPVQEPEAPSPEVPPSPVNAPTVSSGEPQKVNIALSLTFAGLKGGVIARPSLPEIRTLIQPEQRDRFVTHIFKGDAAHYAGALVMLDALKTWRDADAFLRELYRSNILDPGSGEAIEFSDIIRRRYATIEKAP